jgi:[ribosomal protein S18]-alanine N-acetyltransferase
VSALGHCRPAELADLVAVERLDRAARTTDRPPQYWTDEHARSQAHIAVLEVQGQVCGFTAVWSVAGEVELHDIVVDAQHRGQGLGGQLLAALRSVVGPAPIFLEVRADNAPARALYARMGFEQVGTRRRYYADGCDAVIYVWSVA